MKNLFQLSILLIGASLFFSSCGDDNVSVEMQRTIDRELIREYLSDQNLTAMADSTGTGLFFVVEREGGTAKPSINSTVRMDYLGYYLDGTKFDSSYDRGEALVAPLRNLIRGWQEGVQFFGKGGTGILIIPSELGYGPTPPQGVRANAVLVFEIALHDFN